MQKNLIIGHFLALFSNVVWGSTFIATKVLLEGFSPTSVMFIRFFIAYILIWLVCPKTMSWQGTRNEFLMLLAGISGVTIYYQLENVALTYTYASNVGVIFAVIPLFVGFEAAVLLKGKEKISKLFWLGFVVAITGIVTISVNGAENFNLNPLGDLIAFIGCFIWSFYAIILKFIKTKPNVSLICVTRRIFFYAVLAMIPCLLIFDKGWNVDYNNLLDTKYLLCFIYLALFATVLCYISWNKACAVLGAVSTSAYIYLGPVVTVALSALILSEEVTWISIIGSAMTLLGLFISEYETFKKALTKNKASSES